MIRSVRIKNDLEQLRQAVASAIVGCQERPDLSDRVRNVLFTAVLRKLIAGYDVEFTIYGEKCTVIVTVYYPEKPPLEEEVWFFLTQFAQDRIKDEIAKCDK